MSEDLQFSEMQSDLWDLANKYIGAEDRTAVLALCGNMMSVCMQLYTVVLQDEDIESVLNTVSKDIPLLRAKMESNLSERTLH